jgi:tetratricopeptide (TPR) repeat protein
LSIEESCMRVLLRLLLLGLVIMALGPARALAQSAPAVDKVKVAKQYVDAGLAAQSTGDYDTAIAMYSKAYQLVPHPVLIFNMAQAHRLAGHIDQALALYAQYLAEDPKGAEAHTARELVAELRARKADPARTAEADAAHKPRPRPVEVGHDDQPDDGSKRVARKARSEPVDDRPISGTLVVNARDQGGGAITGGTVMIDEEPRGKLDGGKLTVAEVALGRHTVAIEAGGYQRFEDTVTVHGGEPARLDALLHEQAAPSPAGHRRAWKVALSASAGVAVTGLVFAAYSYSRLNDQIGPGHLEIMGEAGATVGVGDCGRSYQEILDTNQPRVTSFNYAGLQRACTWRSRIYIGYLLGGLGAVGTVVSLIMLTRDTGTSEPPATGAHGKKPEVAILPIVMPDGGGASLSLTW